MNEWFTKSLNELSEWLNDLLDESMNRISRMIVWFNEPNNWMIIIDVFDCMSTPTEWLHESMNET